MTKQSAIKLDDDVVMQLNILKYKWKLKTQSETFRKVMEIIMKIDTADKFKVKK